MSTAHRAVRRYVREWYCSRADLTVLQEFLVWNPPFKDERDLQAGRVSTVTEASRLFRFLMDRGARVIVFCKVRPHPSTTTH